MTAFFLIAAVLAAVLCTAIGGLSPWWLPLLAIGWWATLQLLYLLLLWIVSLFLPRRAAKTARGRAACRRVTVLTCQWLCGLARIRLTVEGAELLPTDGRFVLVSNHLSDFDPMIVMARFPRCPLIYLTKEGNLHLPIAGPFIRAAGFLSIDRDDPRSAAQTIREAADFLRTGEASVGVYPEGTRSRTGVLLPFHDGVFGLAKKAGLPLVVMTVRGTGSITKNVPFRQTPVTLRFLEVIPADEIAVSRDAAIGARVRSRMEELPE